MYNKTVQGVKLTGKIKDKRGRPIENITVLRVSPEFYADIAACEHESHAVDDGDFGLRVLPLYAKPKDEIARLAKATFATSSKTRMKAAMVSVKETRKGLLSLTPPKETDWYCGAVHYRVLDEGFHIDWVTAHPSTGLKVYEALVRHVMDLTKDNRVRNVVSVQLPDADNSYKLFPMLKKMGFDKPELQVREGTDFWQLDWVNKEAGCLTR